jgi:hypothetical protein
MSGREQSGYYRTIAGEFIRRRGAPFFLSPRDVALVARWESLRIPLDAVLEGIERAFENSRKRGRPGKVMTLAFCEAQVMKAFGQHAERSAGGTEKVVPRFEKKDRLGKEAARFLATVPPGLAALAGLFEQAVAVTRLPDTDEQKLEKLDDEVDEILWRSSLPGEREEVRKDIRVEFAGKRGFDIEEIVRTRLVKARRDRYKVPYLSLFYY